jgi:amino acid transporter
VPLLELDCSLTGIAAAENAGPAVTLSFILAAVGCAFAGLCYAEFASMIPVAGVLTRTHMPQWANLLLG